MFLKHKFTKNLLVPSLSLLIFLVLATANRVEAATLLLPTDYLTSDATNATGVIHNVAFIIPAGGHTITSTDYIRIILTNYSNVTAPTSGSGWSGTPTYSVNGNVALVTNVTASPTDGIGISGITATNPNDADDFDITIEIANDASGTVVYDSVTFDAETLKGTSTVSVTIGGITSSIELFGFTSPNAFVTILLDGGVGGTTSANGSGNFHHQLTGLTPSITYNVGIYAEDTSSRQTQTVSFNVDTLPSTNHVISNIAVPTTISLAKSTIKQKDEVAISGRAHPYSQIVVFVDSYSDIVQANSSGNWSYNFNSHYNPLLVGTHYVYAKEIVSGGYESIFTQNLSLQVQSCHIADINCDGGVNLTDFSIMLYYWNQTNPANHRSDINRDHKVNLTDFSIMLFHWTG
ncbi:dockerin type I domain-containing protein [Patescibacteria group bacterium]